MHKKILSNSGYLALASLIEKAGSFLMIPILTSALSSKNYGLLMLAVSYAGFIILFIYNGLQSAFFRWYSLWQENFDKKVYEKVIFYFINITGIFFIILMFFMNSFFNFEKFLGVGLYLLLATVLASLLNIVFVLKGIIWVSENKAYNNLFFSLLKTVFTVSGVYLLIKIYPYPITKPVVEILVIGILSSYFIYEYFFYYPKINGETFKKVIPVLKESLIYGWGLQISQLAFWVITSSDRIMVSHFMGNSYVAYYSVLMVGITIMFVIVAFNNSFSVFYNKMISENVSVKEINRYLFTYLIYAFIIILVYKFILFYFSSFIISLLSTKEYLVVSDYMYLTSDILLFYFAYLLFSRYFHAKKMIKIIIATVFISAVVNVMLNYFFIKMFGVLGALIATITAYLSMSLISFFFLYKKTGFDNIKKLMFLFLSVVCIDFLIDVFLYKGW